MKWAPNKQLHFEIAVIKAVQTLQETTLSDVIRILSGATEGVGISMNLESGTSAPSQAAPVPAASKASMSTLPKEAKEEIKASPSPAPQSPPPKAVPAPEHEPAKEPAKPKPTVSSEPAPDAKKESATSKEIPEAAPPTDEEPKKEEAPQAFAEERKMFSDLRDSMKQSAAAPKSRQPETADTSTAEAAPKAQLTEQITNTEDGAALWQRTVEVLAEQKPLQVAWAREGAFLELKENALIIGFEKENSGHREQLERKAVRQSIEAIVSAAAGREMAVHYEVRDEISAAKPVLPDPPEESESDSGGESGAAADSAPPEIDESFYEDPAIKSALKIFNAKIKGKP